MKNKLNIAILYGGKSVEHEISVKSAKNVFNHIDKSKFNVILLGIDKRGTWYLNDDMERPISAGRSAALVLDAFAPLLMDTTTNRQIYLDIVFPVLHGTDGEDGSIQGLFKSVGLPVLGSGVLGSAVSMDKIISKKVLKESGIPAAAYLEFNKLQKDTVTFSAVAEALGLPFMIKSAALGSSVGITMIKSEEDFIPALEESFKYGEKVIIERFVKGRELECAVMGNEHPEASYPCEIVLVKDYDFYTYEAKYLDEGAVRIDLPANLDEKTTEEIRRISVEAYTALRCEDFARVDLFLTESGEILVNEINTIPGFTNASMFPMMWQNMGMSYRELLTRLVDLCLKRYKGSKETETDFNESN